MLVTEAAQNLALRLMFILGMFVGAAFCMVSIWLLVAVIIVSFVVVLRKGADRGAFIKLFRRDAQDTI
jgi:hypothetical protein